MIYIRKIIVRHLLNILFTDEYPKQKKYLVILYRWWIKLEPTRNVIRWIIWRV